MFPQHGQFKANGRSLTRAIANGRNRAAMRFDKSPGDVKMGRVPYLRIHGELCPDVFIFISFKCDPARSKTVMAPVFFFRS